MALDTVIHAQIQAEGCTAELYVNGIPVSRIDPDRTPFESVAVEQHLIPGRNRIEVLVEPGPHPSVARTEGRYADLGAATAVGRLVRFADGVFAEPSRGDVLVEVKFEPDPDHPGPRVFPASVSTEVDLGPANGRWAWQDAPVLELDEPTVAEAARVLDAIAAGYQSLSAQTLWALSELNIKDTLRAYPALDEAALRADLELILQHYGQKPERVHPRAADQHDFRVVAGGRMIECVDRDWKPSLRLKDPDDESAIPYPVLLARIDGRLGIVR